MTGVSLEARQTFTEFVAGSNETSLPAGAEDRRMNQQLPPKQESPELDSTLRSQSTANAGPRCLLAARKGAWDSVQRIAKIQVDLVARGRIPAARRACRTPADAAAAAAVNSDCLLIAAL
ncbi:hypothetical protein VTI74DRAFT_8504 [Chaetomium olivicolor]